GVTVPPFDDDIDDLGVYGYYEYIDTFTNALKGGQFDQYGAPAPGVSTTVFGYQQNALSCTTTGDGPNCDEPDLEFQINNFSALMGPGFDKDQTFSIKVKVFANGGT